MWWAALHAALAAAALLVRVPASVALLALAGVAVHAWLRWPGPGPEWIVIAVDGACSVPGRAGPMRPGPHSRLARRWVRLVSRADGLDLLLVADQVRPEEWARVSALLRRLWEEG